MTHYIANTDLFPQQQDIRSALPLPPPSTEERKDDMAIYARFMRHLRHVPNSRVEIKILSAIQFTADMMDLSDAHVAKVLVDLGLRAPRVAFPADFLSFIDQALMRSPLDIGGPNAQMVELRDFWNSIGEDKFAAFKTNFDVPVAALSA